MELLTAVRIIHDKFFEFQFDFLYGLVRVLFLLAEVKQFFVVVESGGGDVDLLALLEGLVITRAAAED